MTRDMPRKHVPEGLLLHVKRPGSPMAPFLVLRRIQRGLSQPRRPGQGPNPRTGRLGEEMCSSLALERSSYWAVFKLLHYVIN